MLHTCPTEINAHERPVQHTKSGQKLVRPSPHRREPGTRRPPRSEVLLLDPRQRQQPLSGHVSALGGDLGEVDGSETPKEARRLTRRETNEHTGEIQCDGRARRSKADRRKQRGKGGKKKTHSDTFTKGSRVQANGKANELANERKRVVCKANTTLRTVIYLGIVTRTKRMPS